MSNGVNTLRGWLNVLVIINILFLIYIWGKQLITDQQSLNIVLEMTSYTVMVITNIVGIVYLVRNLRLGIYILFIIPLLLSLLSFVFIGYIPSYMYISFFLAVITFIGMLIKIAGKSVWEQMKAGVDWKHFRHIYQLSFILLFLTVGYGGYVYYELSENSMGDKPALGRSEVLNETEVEKSLKALDRITITLGQISEIEKVIVNVPPKYEARIMALRHILAGHIVSNSHDIKAFKMAYTLRRNALSQAQQEVLDWFFRQNEEVVRIWQESDGCESIDVFQKRLKRIIKEKKIREL